jgi:hypothetical protein
MLIKHSQFLFFIGGFLTMKKILCLFLVLVLTCSLCACGGNNDGGKTPETNAPTVETPNTENTEPEINAEDLTAKYKAMFLENKIEFAGNSLNMHMGDMMDIKIMETANGEKAFSMAVSGNEFYMMQSADGAKTYIHLTMTSADSNETVDNWYEYKPTQEGEGQENIMGSMTEDFNKDSFSIDAESIKDVKFIERKDGIDVVEITLNTEGEAPITAHFDAESGKLVMMMQNTEDGQIVMECYNTESIEITIPEGATVEECDEMALMTMYLGIFLSGTPDIDSGATDMPTDNIG